MYKNKKGQYYLMAAAIIVAVILGMSVATNYITTKKKPVKFYDLGDELKEEAAMVMDYGIYNEMDINELMEDFTEDFIKYAAANNIAIDIDFIFIYGNSSGIQIVIYTNNTLDTGRMSYETLFEDSEADYICDGGAIDSLPNVDYQNVLIKNCQINNPINMHGGNLKIISSTILGNIDLRFGTNFELVDSTVHQKIDIMDGNIFIIHNTIYGKVMIKGDIGTVFITDNVLQGGLTIDDCEEIYQIDNNVGSIDTGLCIEKEKNNIKIALLDNTYDFNLKERENFIFIMTKEEGGEVYIVKGEL